MRINKNTIKYLLQVVMTTYKSESMRLMESIKNFRERGGKVTEIMYTITFNFKVKLDSVLLHVKIWNVSELGDEKKGAMKSAQFTKERMGKNKASRVENKIEN